MRVLSSPFLPINCMEVGRPSSVNPFNKVIDGCPEKLVGAENLTKGGISSMGETACGGTAEIEGAGFGMPGHTITSTPLSSSFMRALVDWRCLVALA